MRSLKDIMTLAIGSAAMALSACQNPACTSAGDASEPAPRNATLLYSDTFADGGVLQIVSGPDNEINYSVQTPIGSEAEKRMRISSSRVTLAEVPSVPGQNVGLDFLNGWGAEEKKCRGSSS